MGGEPTIAFEMGVWGTDWFPLAFDLVLTLPPLAETGVLHGLLDMVLKPELVNPLLLDEAATTSVVVFLFREGDL